MARYIDAYKLEKDLPQSVPKHNVIINGNEYPVFLVDHILHKIRNYPTADVEEVKHGEWIIDTSIKARGFYEVNYKVLITCSICGNRHCLGEQPYPIFKQEELKTDTYRKYRYCGECGAKMDGVKGE